MGWLEIFENLSGLNIHFRNYFLKVVPNQVDTKYKGKTLSSFTQVSIRHLANHRAQFGFSALGPFVLVRFCKARVTKLAVTNSFSTVCSCQRAFIHCQKQTFLHCPGRKVQTPRNFFRDV
jgi:hypothetical protein